ncbi:E3 ubiquitin-protein ligase UHRF1 [Halotydeus destructor]|nr:E3 ubiquitin-protein ligase UHRF1 [Halotydeus destructor]
MFVQIRRFDSDSGERIACRSVKEDIDELKRKVAEKLAICDASFVRLFYDGKELQSGLTIFHYGIKLNHVIQVLIREPTISRSSGQLELSKSTIEPLAGNELLSAEGGQPEVTNLTSELDDSDEIYDDKFYSVGDHVDGLHPEHGSWFEGTVRSVRRLRTNSCTLYHVLFGRTSLATGVIPLELNKIRPQSGLRVPFEHVQVGQRVLANFNLNQVNPRRNNCEKEEERGLWFDALITKKDVHRKRLYGTIFIGHSVRLQDQRLRFINELYAIHHNAPKDERGMDINKIITQGPVQARLNAFECSQCQDCPQSKCTACSCKECGGKNDPEKQLLCDECDKIFHIWCLARPLQELPGEEEDWYCPGCKNDDNVIIQERQSEHMAKKSSELQCRSKGAEWGRGMACVGRSVPTRSSVDIFGPVAGIEVGTWWRYRVQVSEAGLHTPLVAGICGKQNVGASSIVVSCAYADDIDLGNEIYYTGSGGRDCAKSKVRVGGLQTRDQELNRTNRALAFSCFAPLDDRQGANAKDKWKLGKPVRVLRSGNSRGASKRSPYLPKGGVRYDGIYKVVKYWPQKSDATGLRVWRYLLRRDDPAHPPWTKEGKLRLKRLGLHQIIEP